VLFAERISTSQLRYGLMVRGTTPVQRGKVTMKRGMVSNQRGMVRIFKVM
jgi:hypothetical protein